jgi:hypothetical protein
VSTSLTQDIETPADQICAIAARLLGGSVDSFEPIGGGRNSRVYRVLGADRKPYALKAYFRHACDNRDRLKTEFEGLRFLWQHGIENIPQPLAADPQAGFALYGYADGDKIAPGETTAADIEQAVAFLCLLKDLANAPESNSLPTAAEACFSGSELLSNLLHRLDRLGARQPGSPGSSMLHEFLNDEFLPAFDTITAWSRSVLPFDDRLSRNRQTLSPSDFGFHNAVRRPSGDWVFLDFEYFGWDDPAKMISDFLLHPAMSLTEDLKRQYIGRLMVHFSEDRSLAARVKYLYPLFGLKWCMILLNEFLPEHFQRREFAAGSEKDLQAVQVKQLTKAWRMLQQVESEYEHFPYLD